MKFCYFLLIVFSFSAGSGCISAPQNGYSTHLINLSKIEQLPLGSNTKTIEQILGSPTEMQSINDLKNTTAWVYFDNHKINRVTLIVDKISGRLLAKTWQIEDGDLERDIQTTLKRYPKANFKLRHAKWIADFLPDEAYYEDLALGLSIKVRKKRQEVLSISWFLPENELH